MSPTGKSLALNRRKFIQLGGVSLVAAPSIFRGSAAAQSGELRVANWGGDWNERVVRAFEDPFIISKGIKVIHELSNPPERKAKLLAEPEPTSFADLWNPKYENRVGLNDGIYFQYIYAASLSQGGSMGNVDKAFPALLDMKKAVKPRLYPTHQALAAAFNSEEVWISANYSSRIIQWGREGVPVKWAYPKEGAVFTSFGAGLPKKGLNREAAYYYLNAMLEPKAAGKIAELTSYPPSTTNAEMSDDVRKSIAFTPAQLEKFNFVDYAYAAKNDSKWVEWWNKEFKA